MSSKIAQRLAQIKAYESYSTQTIVEESFARKGIDLLDNDILSNPNITYGDYQCGSGTLLLYLAERLMNSLAEAIPNETKRLKHIFQKQLFASDIDPVQVLVCKANFKKIFNDRKFSVNVEQKDFNNINNDQVVDVIISAITFSTTNIFIEKFKPICKNILVLTRPNKNQYTKSKHIQEITKYRFLGVTKTHTPICAMYFTSDQSNSVTFISDETSIVVKNPKFLPGNDLKSFRYACDLIDLELSTFEAHYGSYYSNAEEVVNNPGDVHLIYQVGGEGSGFRKTIRVSKDIITAKEGVGRYKAVISKNGNRGKKSALKYAGPKYGTGHNAVWLNGNSRATILKWIDYYNSKEITQLVLSIKATSPANGVGFWSMIPHYDNYTKVKEIYAKHYG